MLLRLDHRRLAVQREPEPKQARKYYTAKWFEEDWADDASGHWTKSSTFSDVSSVYDFVFLYAEETADLLEQYGINLGELFDSAPWLK